MNRSVVVLGIIVLLSVAAPILAPYDPLATSPNIRQQPNGAHPLGTDHLGRDVLSRVFYGGWQTLWVAGMACMVATIPGVLVGLGVVALGEFVQRVYTIVANSLLAIPVFMIALVLMTLFGRGTIQLAVATGFALIPACSQVARTTAYVIKQQPYIEASNALGSTRRYIFYHHVLPNARPTLLAYMGVTFSQSMLNSTALSFLGLGTQLGVPDWGVMLAEGRYGFRSAPWVMIIPGLLIFITVSAVNMLVDSQS